MVNILGEKHLHLHHCHEKIKSIEPTWLTHSLLVLVWVWPHSLAVTCIICDSDACCSSRSQDPALISEYSHPKPQHTKSKINKAAASIAVTIHVTASECCQTLTKTNHEWVNHVGSMLLIFSWHRYAAFLLTSVFILPFLYFGFRSSVFYTCP